MNMTFRWYGENDPVTLDQIRQIPGITSVVTAVYDTPVGTAWSEASIAHLKNLCQQKGLGMEVIESVPVHEDIKLRRGRCDEYIEHYCTTVERLAGYGVKCICYNFMPVFDWTRTSLHTPLSDGSESLSYLQSEICKADPKTLSLPGWDESYTKEELQSLLKAYKSVSHEQLFENLVYFLSAVIPVCERVGINLAIHPDDPPWDIFGLPRIVSRAEDYERLFEAVPSNHNGITFCTGSLGAGRFNNLPEMAYRYAKLGKIHFAHIRNIRYIGDSSDEQSFQESGHLTRDGSLDMYAIMHALYEGGFTGYIRPDHGRNIWGEQGKPGYGLYDRALGAAYLNGLWEGIAGGKC